MIAPASDHDPANRPSTSRASNAAVSVRPCTPADGAAVWRLSEKESSPEAMPPYVAARLRAMAGSQRDCAAFIAEREGRTVGYVLGYRPSADNHALRLWSLGLDDDHGSDHATANEDAVAVTVRLLTALGRSLSAMPEHTIECPIEAAAGALARATLRRLGLSVGVLAA